MDMLADLQSKTGQGFTMEYGYQFKLGPNGQYIFSPAVYGSGINQSISFTFNGSDGWTGCAHSHYAGCGNVFSFGDLPFIWMLRNVTPNILSFMYGLATEHGYYFLTITDVVAYYQWWNKLFPDGIPNIEEIRRWEDMFNDDYGVNNGSSLLSDEKALLKFLQENNIGLGVMKYNNLQDRFNRLMYYENIDVLLEDECPPGE